MIIKPLDSSCTCLLLRVKTNDKRLDVICEVKMYPNWLTVITLNSQRPCREDCLGFYSIALQPWFHFLNEGSVSKTIPKILQLLIAWYILRVDVCLRSSNKGFRSKVHETKSVTRKLDAFQIFPAVAVLGSRALN